ncbi:putative metallocarboxypeptidase ecm14 isoform X2 [Cimex lectularius]|nr:putative metallocarboxypeptidase ecm14 isoform X2 [Cimex lectularius]
MINKGYLSSKEIVSLLKLICKEEKLKYMSIGETAGGQEIPGVFVGEENGNKPVVLIEAGCHPREKVAAAAAIYAIGQLAKEKKDKILTKILETVDLAIAPLLNPDGYLFAIETDENWRKNRNNTFINHCRGIDINRNFSYKWKEGGAERIRDPCSQFYCGSEPFSEAESCALRDFFLCFEPRVKMYLSLHSPDQSIVYPWSYDLTQPEDREQLELLAWNVSDKIREKFYTEFDVGQSSSLIGRTAGTSLDWAKAIANVKYCYSIYLPGPQYGYNMPPELIPHFGHMLLEMIGTFVQIFTPRQNGEGKCTKDKGDKNSNEGPKSKRSILQMKGTDGSVENKDSVEQNKNNAVKGETEEIQLKDKETPTENKNKNEEQEIPKDTKQEAKLANSVETKSADEIFNTSDKNNKETKGTTVVEQPTPSINQALEDILTNKENPKEAAEHKENNLLESIFDLKKEPKEVKINIQKENQITTIADNKTRKTTEKSEENKAQQVKQEVKNKQKLNLKRDVIVIRDRPTAEAMRKKSQYITRDIKEGINMSKMKGNKVEIKKDEPCKTVIKQEASKETKDEEKNEVWIKEAIKKVSKKMGKKPKKAEKNTGPNKTWIKDTIKMAVKKDGTKQKKVSKKAPKDR